MSKTYKIHRELMDELSQWGEMMPDILIESPTGSHPRRIHGETKDLIDKVKLYSNLRLKAYETGVHSPEGGAVRDEADGVLEEIAKDTDRLVKMSCRGDHEEATDG